MTDMKTVLARAGSAGFRVMEDARFGKPDECVDWEGVFDRVANTILATLAAEMAAAELKVVAQRHLFDFSALLDCYRDVPDEGLRDRPSVKRSVSGHTIANARAARASILGRDAVELDDAAALRPERETGEEG